MKRSYWIVVACIVGFFLILGVASWRANSPATPEDISKAVAGLTLDQRRQFETVIRGIKMSALSKFKSEPLTRHDLREAIKVVTADSQIIDEQDAALKRALQNGNAPLN